MGLPRQECWSGWLFFSLADLPNPGTKSVSPALAGGFFITEPQGSQVQQSWDHASSLASYLFGLGHVVYSLLLSVFTCEYLAPCLALHLYSTTEVLIFQLLRVLELISHI